MKAKWAKVLLMVAIIGLAPLVLTQAVFSAIKTNTSSIHYTFGTVFGAFLSRIDSASEPFLLLILGAFLIVFGVRIRQMFTVEAGQ